MHLTAETYWTADFAAGVLARRAGIRYVPYAEFVSLEQAQEITGWPLHRVLNELDIVTLATEYSVVHPDCLVPFYKKAMMRVLNAAIRDQNAASQEIQSALKSSQSKRAA